MNEAKIWLVLIDQDHGSKIVIPCTDKAVARQHAERTVRRLFDSYIAEWVDHFGDETSLLGVNPEERSVIVTRRTLHSEPNTKPVDLEEATKQQAAGSER